METIDTQNQALLAACLVETPDPARIEALLRAGANPLGVVEGTDGKDLLYNCVIEHFVSPETPDAAFVWITELFLRYGMDLSAPELPYDSEKILHPMWLLAFGCSENTLRVLELLLDHSLDAEAVGICWGHVLFDYYNCWGRLEDAYCYELLYFTIRELLLIASYPHVLYADADLQQTIWLSENTYDARKFRHWNDFSFEIDTSHCNRGYPEVYRSLVTVREKNSGNAVWKFGFGLAPGAL